MVNIDDLVTVSDAAALLKCSREYVEKLMRSGWFRRADRGVYRLAELINGYVDYIHDRDKRSEVSAAQSIVQQARAEEIRLRAAERAGRLVDVEELFYLANALAGMVRSRHVGAASRITRDLALRATIQTELDSIDAAIADELTALAARHRDGRAYSAPTGNGNAGRVGIEEQNPSDGLGDSGSS